ncbi:cbh, partial [Symbiodinium necroappetens]
EILKHMYTNLYSTSSVDLPKSVAKSSSLELMKAYAQPDQVKELYAVLYSTTGVNLPKKDAQ